MKTTPIPKRIEAPNDRVQTRSSMIFRLFVFMFHPRRGTCSHSQAQIEKFKIYSLSKVRNPFQGDLQLFYIPYITYAFTFSHSELQFFHQFNIWKYLWKSSFCDFGCFKFKIYKIVNLRNLLFLDWIHLIDSQQSVRYFFALIQKSKVKTNIKLY